MYAFLGKLLTHGEDMLQILRLLMLGKAMQGYIDLPQSAVHKNITTCVQQGDSPAFPAHHKSAKTFSDLDGTAVLPAHEDIHARCMA